MVAYGMVQLFFFGVSLAVDWRNFTLTRSIYFIWIDSTSITIKYYTVHIPMYKKLESIRDFQIYYGILPLLYPLSNGRPYIVLRNFLEQYSTLTVRSSVTLSNGHI